MPRPIVTHLIDDLTAGGVTRVLDHLLTAPEMAGFADHRLKRVTPGTTCIGHVGGDIIVSHLAVSWRMLPAFVSLRVCNPKARLIHVEHSYTEGFVALNVPRKSRFEALLRLTYRLFDTVVAVSEAQRDWLEHARFVRPCRLTAIPSCVGLSAFRALPAPEGRQKVLGAIGRLEPQKGFDLLVAAFVRTLDPALELRIFGTGSQEACLRRLAGADPRVRFMGFAKDPVDAMRQVDIVAMPSRWEAYGLVAIEALSAGRTLLVSDVDGLRDHLKYGAITPDTDTVAGWTSAIETATTATPHTHARQQPGLAFEQVSIANWQRLLAATGTENGASCRTLRDNRFLGFPADAP